MVDTWLVADSVSLSDSPLFDLTDSVSILFRSSSTSPLTTSVVGGLGGCCCWACFLVLPTAGMCSGTAGDSSSMSGQSKIEVPLFDSDIDSEFLLWLLPPPKSGVADAGLLRAPLLA